MRAEEHMAHILSNSSVHGDEDILEPDISDVDERQLSDLDEEQFSDLDEEQFCDLDDLVLNAELAEHLPGPSFQKLFAHVC